VKCNATVVHVDRLSRRRHRVLRARVRGAHVG
jgi:hypothetical protein